jgi:hypothetical protein
MLKTETLFECTAINKTSLFYFITLTHSNGIEVKFVIPKDQWANQFTFGVFYDVFCRAPGYDLANEPTS